MMPDIMTQLEAKFREHPFLAAKEVPLSAVQPLEDFAGFGLPADYKEFVRRFGGAMVGAYPIFGVIEAEVMGDGEIAISVTERFRADGWPGTEDWLVIPVDHAGNPIGIDGSGVVWISDHDTGTVDVLAKSFKEYIVQNCLGMRS
jgi:hypothetical protein